MPSSIAQKLKIKEGYALLTVNAPSDFALNLGDLPPAVTVSPSINTFDQIHWFVWDKAELDRGLQSVMAKLKKDVSLWIYFPKGSSGIQTDLTRDTGWDTLSRNDALHFLGLYSFNEIWSVFSLRLKTEADKKKEAKPKERAVFKYIDTAKKEVYLPEDFAAAMEGAEKERSFFHSLSFTNKKEYVEWIVSAKRDETRRTRVKESVERLAKGWKNPANR